MKIPYANITTKDEAFSVVKRAVTPEMLAKWKVKAELAYEADLIKAKGKGFKLDLCFFEEYCEIKVDLSLILRPLKKKIMEGLEKQLTRIL